MKLNIIRLTCGMALLGATVTASAQSTWNYFISDAGNGYSLVTWTVTGSITTSSGVEWQNLGGFGGTPVKAPAIYSDSYAGSSPLSMSTLDGSYFYNIELNQSFPIHLYYAYNSSGSGEDMFSLISDSASTSSGQHITYDAGTQSALIPVSFSDFNAGTYQAIWAAGTFFDTDLTVNLTVGAVPEPSTLALVALGGLLIFRRRK